MYYLFYLTTIHSVIIIIAYERLNLSSSETFLHSTHDLLLALSYHTLYRFISHSADVIKYLYPLPLLPFKVNEFSSDFLE